VGKIIKFSTPAEAIAEHTDTAKPQRGKGNNIQHDAIAPSWPVVRFINGREVMCFPQEFTVNNADGGMEARRDQVKFIYPRDQILWLTFELCTGAAHSGMVTECSQVAGADT
jgi:hypothetical protein